MFDFEDPSSGIHEIMDPKEENIITGLELM